MYCYICELYTMICLITYKFYHLSIDPKKYLLFILKFIFLFYGLVRSMQLYNPINYMVQLKTTIFDIKGNDHSNFNHKQFINGVSLRNFE